MTRRLLEDDRGVSIAVSHVMSIAITAILISGMMFGASALLEGEKDRSAGQSLETIGERLSGEISSVDRLADEDTETLRVTVDHPRTVSGSQYTIDLEEECSTPLIKDDQSCLRLESHGGDVEVGVPVKTSNADVTDSSATGGTIVIKYEDEGDDEISIERDSR
ncbi:DUF7266 family protein [Natrialbaceae archaeon A-gly3]